MKRKETRLILRSDPPNGTKSLPGKRDFTKKVKHSGEIRHKALWVVRGDLMRASFSDNEIFALVAEATSTRTLYAVATYHGWVIRQTDEVITFLNGTAKICLHASAYRARAR